MPCPELRTARLNLAPVEVRHQAALNTGMNHWNVIRMLGTPAYPHPMEATAAFIAKAREQNETGLALQLAIECGGETVGVVGIDPRERGPSLGYWLAETHWGRGLISEAAQAVVDHWFATRPGETIASGAFKYNPASLRVQEKLGFEVVGEHMVYSRPRNSEQTHVDTALTRARWQTRRALVQDTMPH